MSGNNNNFNFALGCPSSDVNCNRDWCGIGGYICSKCCDIHKTKYEKFLAELIIPPPKMYSDCKNVETQT